MEGQIAENPLGTQMLSRLLVRFAIPGMVPGKLFHASFLSLWAGPAADTFAFAASILLATVCWKKLFPPASAIPACT